MLRHTILLAVFLCMAMYSFAQNLYLNYPLIDEQCGTPQLKNWKQQNFPNIESNQEFEEWLSRKIDERNFVGRMDEVISIPTVVHVIHDGEAVGVYPNISDAQIISQINVLNQDFRKMTGTNGYNDHPDGADIEIEFCLVAIDPDLNPSNGIDRHDLGNNEWDMAAIESEMKPNTIWNPNDYFNIWVCDISSTILLGYAQFPTSSGLEGINETSGADTDGVLVGAEYFGTVDEDDGTFVLDDVYNLGRTATHEVGHFLGLLHPWGEGGCSSTDYCDDTPETDAGVGGCPVSEFSCGSEDMVENYMDYTDDVCANIFTNDQKSRIRTVLENSPRRASLINSILCSPPVSFAYSGVVIDATTQEAIPNASVIFQGDFVLEITANSEGEFDMPNFYEGTYEVISGSWGYLTTLMDNEFIDANRADFVIELTPGYYDDFMFDYGWEVTDYAQKGEWERGIPLGSTYNEIQFDPETDNDSDFGEYCFLTGNGGGSAGVSDVDNGTTTLVSPIFDASLYQEPKLSFYRWFATKNVQAPPPDDYLEIRISNGINSEVIRTIDGDDENLSTWVYESFIISDYIVPTDNMQVSFSVSDQVTSVEGHLVDAAIDLFRVGEHTIAVDDYLEEEIGFMLFPNPTTGEIIIEIEKENLLAEIQIFNAIGQDVFSQKISDSRIKLDLENQAKGIYFLQFNMEGRFFVKRILVN